MYFENGVSVTGAREIDGVAYAVHEHGDGKSVCRRDEGRLDFFGRGAGRPPLSVPPGSIII